MRIPHRTAASTRAFAEGMLACMPYTPDRPGDFILDHRLPDASAPERNAARERLYAFARVLMEIAVRIEREAPQPDSRDPDRRPRMGGHPPHV